MGEVYLAEHQLMKRPVAIKVIRPEKAHDPQTLKRFEREVRATSRLSHWNTVEIFDYGQTEDGAFYYVMEYLPGLSLAELVQRYGPVAPERAVHLLAGACEVAAENQLEEAERRAWAKRAVEEYQELIRRSPGGFIRPGEAALWMPVPRLASARISALVKKYGPETYDGVARAAAADLKKAGKNPAALQAVIALYPGSPAALEALDLVAGTAAAQGKWTAAATAWIDMRSRMGERWTPAHQRRLHDAWEKAGDAERLLKELKWAEDLFKKDARVGSEENAPTVEEHLAAMRKLATMDSADSNFKARYEMALQGDPEAAAIHGEIKHLLEL
jgi:hypothetical protein